MGGEKFSFFFFNFFRISKFLFRHKTTFVVNFFPSPLYKKSEWKLRHTRNFFLTYSTMHQFLHQLYVVIHHCEETMNQVLTCYGYKIMMNQHFICSKIGGLSMWLSGPKSHETITMLSRLKLSYIKSVPSSERGFFGDIDKTNKILTF